MQREYRNFNFEIRKDPGDKKYIVRGYATTYGDAYTLYSDNDYEIREIIDKNAFSTTDLTDVIMQYNHEGRVFARTSNGSLKIKSNTAGLFIEADLSGTEAGRQLYNEIEGGYTNKMSIGFKVDKAHDVWKRSEAGGKVIETRIINRILELYDVSAVSIPANPHTTIKA